YRLWRRLSSLLMLLFVFFFFFFSSRRRHTRWPRDWSSDVCSSDLQNVIEALQPLLPELLGGSADLTVSNLTATRGSVVVRRGRRSEERRVGKEGRSRWAP